jgi:hypothetical protein
MLAVAIPIAAALAHGQVLGLSAKATSRAGLLPRLFRGSVGSLPAFCFGMVSTRLLRGCGVARLGSKPNFAVLAE